MEQNTIPEIKIPSSEKDVVIPKIEPKTGNTGVLRSFKPRKIMIGVSVFIILLILLVVLPGFFIFRNAQSLQKSANLLVAASKEQNLAKMKNQIKAVESDVKNLKSSFVFVSWMKFIPFLGAYISDANHALTGSEAGLEALDSVIITVEPYTDIIGFGKGQNKSASDGAKTTQERMDFILKSIPDLLPKIDQISGKVGLAKGEFDQIDPARYPEKFKGREVRSNIKKWIEILDQVSIFLTKGKPILESAPKILGTESPKKYLILFQNDKELRPTGGFITAYAIMKVDKARFEPVASSDIYNLDAKYTATIPAPEPIIKYLKGPYAISKNFRLRDLNWSPDFSKSMMLFSEESGKVGIEGIDGIIGVDTQLLVNLLSVIGQIGVPGFGNFGTQEVAKCKCPQVIYELESFADVEGPIVWDPAGTGKIIYAPPNYENRKRIVGPLMNSILANAFGQPKEKLPALFEAVFRSVIEKHVLLYMIDNKTEKAVSGFGVGGVIEEYDGDYLHINDANLGGRKSNLYVTQEIEETVSTGRGKEIVKTVTITYKNSEKYDGWLNSVLPDWVRVYVPKGSTLISTEGLEDKAEPYEDLGKTVFAGFFQLRPQGVSKVTFKYKLPFKAGKEYKLLVQKQPGTNSPLHRINLGRREEETFLKTDKEFKIAL